MKLWESNHPYYCVSGCYYTSESCAEHYESFAAFLDEWKSNDNDLNLLFRWDWQEGEDYEIPSGKAQLELHYFMQRKGYPYTCTVSLTRADEPAVREFLRDKWEHMKTLWAPLSTEAA